MNINTNGKTLYFSDEEIDTIAGGEKKVFVTKRINGKESHVKAERKRSNTGKHLKKDKEEKEDEEIFNFNTEVVLGINKSKEKEKEEKKSRKKKRKQVKKTHEQKYEKKNRAKKKKLNKVVITIITIVVLLVIITIFALMAPIFNITSIDVQGNNKINKEEIISLSSLKIGDNIFRFNNSIISKIKENAYIESAEIKRNLPGTVIISVKERTVKYQVNIINGYTYIDKNGYILEQSSTKSEVPVIVGLKTTEDGLLNQERLQEEDLETLNDISKILDAAKTIGKDNLITEINVENEHDYVLYLESENKRIHIGDTSNLTNKMLYVQKILEGEQGKSGTAYVNGDISAGFKPYFREE